MEAYGFSEDVLTFIFIPEVSKTICEHLSKRAISS